MSANYFDRLLQFLKRLQETKIDYRLDNYREDAVSVLITVPGERWEVDFLKDGSVDVERFRSNGHIYDESILDKLFNEYAADSPELSTDQIRMNEEEFYQHVDLPAKALADCRSPVSAASDQPQK
jgi:hypothetical protein